MGTVSTKRICIGHKYQQLYLAGGIREEYDKDEIGIRPQGEMIMEILLPENETLSIDKVPENVRIVCRSGRIWLTQSGDSRDFLLHAGESFTSKSRGQLVLWALAAAQVDISSQAREAAISWQPALKRA